MIKVLLKPPSNITGRESVRMIKVLLKPPSLHHWEGVGEND
jgi:hypothetical protein